MAGPGGATQPGRPIRLAFGTFLRRLFFGLAAAGMLLLWVSIKRNKAIPRRMRRVVLLMYTPRVLVFAFFVAAVVTVAADLLIRLAVARQVRHWLSPPGGPGDDPGSFGFHLAASERVEGLARGRRRVGRRWRPGTLVRTGRRLWFFPSSWDDDPTAIDLDRVQSAWADPTARLAWGMIRGMPPRVLLDLGDGRVEAFAVADPEALIDWFAPAPLDEPSPHR